MTIPLPLYRKTEPQISLRLSPKDVKTVFSKQNETPSLIVPEIARLANMSSRMVKSRLTSPLSSTHEKMPANFQISRFNASNQDESETTSTSRLLQQKFSYAESIKTPFLVFLRCPRPVWRTTGPPSASRPTNI